MYSKKLEVNLLQRKTASLFSLTAYLGIRKYIFKGVQDLLSLMVDALDASEILNFFLSVTTPKITVNFCC